MLDEKAMEDPRSVNSPRRILSFSRNQKATVLVDSFPDVEEKASVSGISGEHGPNYSEVYGFVGSISTVVASVVFLVWAYVPDPWLHSIGIFYYPSKYWALAIPTYVTVTVALMLLFYIGLNFMATPPPTFFSSMFDREKTTAESRSLPVGNQLAVHCIQLRCITSQWVKTIRQLYHYCEGIAGRLFPSVTWF